MSKVYTPCLYIIYFTYWRDRLPCTFSNPQHCPFSRIHSSFKQFVLLLMTRLFFFFFCFFGLYSFSFSLFSSFRVIFFAKQGGTFILHLKKFWPTGLLSPTLSLPQLEPEQPAMHCSPSAKKMLLTLLQLQLQTNEVLRRVQRCRETTGKLTVVRFMLQHSTLHYLPPTAFS